MTRPSIEAIDALLPQTQCGECGYPGCRPYAEAMANDLTSIGQCPPGGVTTLKALAALLQRDPTPYLADTLAATRAPALALIREAECIGCTKCIQACPVDAIIGSGTLMHSVLPDECTGCGLCIEPCPVDCIELVQIPEPTYDRALARTRFQAHQVRLQQQEQASEAAYRDKRHLAKQTAGKDLDLEAKRAYILQALTRRSTP